MAAEKESPVEITAALLVMVAAAVLGPVAHGWSITCLWSWFVVPAFAMPALNVPQAIGLGLVATALRPIHLGDLAEKEREDDTLTKKAARVAWHCFVHPCFVVAFGYVVSLFL